MTTLKVENGFFVDLNGAGDIYGDIGAFDTKENAHNFADKLPEFFQNYVIIRKYSYVINDGKAKILTCTKTEEECLQEINEFLARNEAHKAYIEEIRLTHDNIDLSGLGK